MVTKNKDQGSHLPVNSPLSAKKNVFQRRKFLNVSPVKRKSDEDDIVYLFKRKHSAFGHATKSSYASKSNNDDDIVILSDEDSKPTLSTFDIKRCVQSMYIRSFS